MNYLYERIGKILETLENRIYPSENPVQNLQYCECGYKTSNVPPEDAIWTPLSSLDGIIYGEKHFWLRGTLSVPNDGKKYVLKNNSVSTGRYFRHSQWLYYIGGEMIAAGDFNHKIIFLSPEDDRKELLAYVYLNRGESVSNVSFSVAERDSETESLFYDIRVPYGILGYSDENSKEYCDIRSALNEAVNLIDFRTNGEDYHASVRAAAKYLNDEFYSKRCGVNDINCVCIGHTHIDVAWLWTFAQTREKVQRSFSTVIHLMKQYPEYKFMSSQPQLYKFLKEEAPDVYAQVRELVREGRWEVEGAMWVEADCNLPSGESLVRQIIYGKRFFREEFGRDSKILWLPDVFGYSAALPQILKKSGVDYFVTSKISWNETNRMPYDVFRWRGIDGTPVLSYFLTAQDKRRGEPMETGCVYNGVIEPAQIEGTWERFQQKDIASEVLHTFGYGDGGGGATYQMLETGKRLARGIPGCPTVKFDTAYNFIKNMDKTVSESRYLPEWSGELYLEYHRGTYTSQARNKRYNRKCEFLFGNAEALSVMGEVLSGTSYPLETLKNSWEKILLCQFHDVIPGSSIREVYEDSTRIYESLFETGNNIADNIKQTISDNIKTDGGLLVFNPNSFEASGEVKTDDGYVYVKNIPSKGYRVVKPEENKQINVSLSDKTLENDFFKVAFDADMNIGSIFDKRNFREVLAEGKKGNVFTAFEDIPRAYDAWEITNYYKEKSWELDSFESVSEAFEGERAGFKITRTFGDSVIEQCVFLYSHTDRIDFVTEIDWKGDHILLKTAFPFDVHTSKATYDIQFGTVERPTHSNTSWDDAKFEVCAHKFADVSECGYGVSLLNDCKYGYDANGATLGLTLIKSATYPDKTADKCHHSFTYSVYPHAGALTECDTVKHAFMLNNPLTAVKVSAQSGTLPESYSLVSIDGENVIVDTVKQSEDGEDIIVRMYETYNMRCRRKLNFGFDFTSVYLCDLLENNEKELMSQGNSVSVDIKPYEIITLKIKR